MSRFRFFHSFLFSVCVIVAVYCACGGLQPIAGGTSETTNGFVAVVHDQNGGAVSRALVRIRPTGYCSDTGSGGIPYLSSSVIDTFTDCTGRFTVTNIDTGGYSIEIQDGMGGGALVRSTALNDSLVDCDTVVIRPVGTIYGTIDRAVVHDSISVYVRVVGLERVVRADPISGLFVLSGMPEGDFTVSITASSPSYASREITAIVVSGGSTDIGKIALFPFYGWTFSRLLSLNTTASGADVAEAVYDFPVLIRLNAGNFTFGQVMTTGEDLRFSKPDSTPLPYEIERWDAANSRAEIWVKLDTVYGNNDSQSIVMYWGNPAVSSASNSAAVFDTADGFQGVWHLSEAGNTTAFDATANVYDGTPNNMTVASSVAGAIGNARAFNGSSQYITMANTASSRLNFPEDGSYCMSVWVCADEIDTLWRAIVGKGHEQYYMQLKCFGNNRATWEFVEFQDQSGWEYTEDSVPPAPGSGTWLNLVGVRSGTSQRLYINGELVIDSPSLMAGAHSRTVTNNFTVGRHANFVTLPYYQGWSYFNGKIDEIRVSCVVPGADWIKLCYMNQKADDALVEFR